MSRPDKRVSAIHQSYFGDPEAARELFESIRWPEGPVCPHCGSIAQAYKLEPRPESRRPVRPGVYKCAACRRQFTVTVGTIFEGSKVGLDKWLYAIHLMCASEQGVSAHQLHREIDVQYKTAWLICHRIRDAMEKEPVRPKLGGVVEADETYLSGSCGRAGVRARRKRAGLSQAALAAKLGKPQSYVSRCELGERRVDVVEFLGIADALGADAAALVAELHQPAAARRS